MKNLIKHGLILLILWSCQSKSTQDEVIQITCTTGMIGDAMASICGEFAEVNVLMGPGVDPHLYKASQGDVMALQAADLVVYNGLHLEGKMTEILDKLENKGKAMALENHVPKASILYPDGQLPDPHIWFDVNLWKETLENLIPDLESYFPEYSAIIQQNADAYLGALSTLNDSVISRMEGIPDSNRILITSHDAFGYFGAAYDVQVKGLQGISTAAEFGLRDVTNLVDYCIQEEVKAVFVESSVSEKSLNSVVEGAQAQGYDLRIGGKLYSDALGGKDTGANTYIGMVNHNVQTIQSALK